MMVFITNGDDSGVGLFSLVCTSANAGKTRLNLKSLCGS